MSFRIATSPHQHSLAQTPALMRTVALACLPGIAAQLYFFGYAVLIQIALAIVTAWASEALMLKIRNKPVLLRLKDHSALVTGLLLALAIPAAAPWWIIVLGTAFAIIVVKQLYGGLGHNLFNPAMAAYVLLLISYPQQMTSWLPPTTLQHHAMTGADPVCLVFSGFSCQGFSVSQLKADVDGRTMATALDTLRNDLTAGKTVSESMQQPVFDGYSGLGWSWINFGFLVGGLFLLQRRVIQWRIPVAVLSSLVLCSSIAWLSDSDRFATPLFQLFSGGTMLAAFFIATDPVSASTTAKGRLIYGALIGLLVFVIRTFGGYPDGWAFAVMLANLSVPLIDAYTKPRTYGHRSGN
ncbi:electron transport complex subunit RsxD [Rheinheimera tilapiae]|uniref:Ion-translocating oxidoreductase complex subunit D n=1 Tax=Rheinheimera tilapiae TaxID=875043 RepID=A0ABV6BGV7_9GAMM